MLILKVKFNQKMNDNADDDTEYNRSYPAQWRINTR